MPQSLSADVDALARLEREAKAVAALSHPNILSIFDFGTQGGVSYAVMELLEGETLRGKFDARPISQKQAVDYAFQIARGLSAAHDKGIVHRDLKPERSEDPSPEVAIGDEDNVGHDKLAAGPVDREGGRNVPRI